MSHLIFNENIWLRQNINPSFLLNLEHSVVLVYNYFRQMPLLRLLLIALCVCVGLNKLKASALLLKTSTTQHACICNTNHPQLVIFECPDRTSQIIGFLYLQDSSFSVDLSPSHCKAIAPSVISPEGWFPVIHDRKVRR